MPLLPVCYPLSKETFAFLPPLLSQSLRPTLSPVETALATSAYCSLARLEELIATLRLQQKAQLTWMVSRIRERIRTLLEREDEITAAELDAVAHAAFEEFAPVFHLLSAESAQTFNDALMPAVSDHVARIADYLKPTGLADVAEYAFRGFFSAMIAIAAHPDVQRGVEADAAAAREHAEQHGGAMPRMNPALAPLQVVRPQIALFLVSEAMEMGLPPARTSPVLTIALQDVVGWLLPRLRAGGLAIDPLQGIAHDERVKRAIAIAAHLRDEAEDEDEKIFADARLSSLR